jgi:glycosyltransferase involved in cell wall biosynthesis
MPKNRSVVIVAPVPPPYGGMALQAQLLRDCLCREGIEVKLISTNPSLPKPLANIKGVRTLVQSLVFAFLLLRELPRSGVVHILAASYLSFFLRVIPAVIVGRFFCRRVIINYRGGAARRFFSAWGWAIRPILRMADVITVPSPYLERVFSEQGFSAQIIPNLIDVGRFRFRKRNVLTPRLLVTRNLEPIYNVKMALQAFEKIKQRYPDSRLDIVGSGTQESELKNWAMERGLKDVFFHGAVPNEKIPVYLGQADILLTPSYVDNMPINLLEAFASGVPVVSSKAGGIPDLVRNGMAALLVEPGNHTQMAEKIEELLTHPEKVEQLTTYAKDLCKGFTWISIRDRLLEVYYSEGKMVSKLQV